MAQKESKDKFDSKRAINNFYSSCRIKSRNHPHETVDFIACVYKGLLAFHRLTGGSEEIILTEETIKDIAKVRGFNEKLDMSFCDFVIKHKGYFFNLNRTVQNYLISLLGDEIEDGYEPSMFCLGMEKCGRGVTLKLFFRDTTGYKLYGQEWYLRFKREEYQRRIMFEQMHYSYNMENASVLKKYSEDISEMYNEAILMSSIVFDE